MSSNAEFFTYAKVSSSVDGSTVQVAGMIPVSPALYTRSYGTAHLAGITLLPTPPSFAERTRLKAKSVRPSRQASACPQILWICRRNYSSRGSCCLSARRQSGGCAIQGSFGRLRIPLDINDNAGRGNLLEVCFRLHNLRTLRVGFNQIQSVYVPIWKDGVERDDIWDGFETLTFVEQRVRDRVARFHITVQYD